MKKSMFLRGLAIFALACVSSGAMAADSADFTQLVTMIKSAGMVVKAVAVILPAIFLVGGGWMAWGGIKNLNKGFADGWQGQKTAGMGWMQVVIGFIGSMLGGVILVFGAVTGFKSKSTEYVGWVEETGNTSGGSATPIP
jgi:hypothetical protein